MIPRLWLAPHALGQDGQLLVRQQRLDQRKQLTLLEADVLR